MTIFNDIMTTTATPKTELFNNISKKYDSNESDFYRSYCLCVNQNYKEEKDNSVTYGYNVPGVRIECKEIWDNKNKKMSLKFSGSAKILDKEIVFTETIPVDTDVYDKYDWHVKDGILYITLFEKINERPKFSRVEKTKKNKTKPTKEEGTIERD